MLNEETGRFLTGLKTPCPTKESRSSLASTARGVATGAQLVLASWTIENYSRRRFDLQTSSRLLPSEQNVAHAPESVSPLFGEPLEVADGFVLHSTGYCAFSVSFPNQWLGVIVWDAASGASGHGPSP